MLQPAPRKRHTKPCLFFQSNTCPLSSEECDFAHVLAEPTVSTPLLTPLRTKPCKFYAAGRCKDGIWCRFKHPITVTPRHYSGEADEARDNSAEQSMDEDDVDDSVPDVRDVDPNCKVPQEMHPKYRTRPCRNFLLGDCPYGEKCTYLHLDPSDARMLLSPTSPDSPMWSAPAPQAGYFNSPATSPGMGRTFDTRGGMSAMAGSFSGAYPYAHTGMPFVTSPHGHNPPRPIPPAFAPKRPARPRSQSQPELNTNLRKPNPKGRLCRQFSATGTCPDGHRCQYVHTVRAPTLSSPQESDTPEPGQDAAMPGGYKSISVEETEAQKKKNFYKINWRVVGGGVIIGQPPARRDRNPLPQSERVSPPQPRRPADASSVIQASILTSRTNSSSSSQTPSLSVGDDDKDETTGEPLSPLVTPSSAKGSVRVTIQYPQGDDEKLDWGDDMEDVIEQTSTPKTLRVFSTPSSPANNPRGVANLFAAETP